MKTLETVDIPGWEGKLSGKVRDMYPLGEGRRALITTDRFSAFDRVIGMIPHKGQVLNQLSAWWFQHTRDILPNHFLESPDPNVAIVKEAQPLPVEVVVRGYITGVTSTSLWTLYAAGERNVYGVTLPEGLQKNDLLPEPLITPTTKATDGGHDERLTPDEVVARGLVEPELWAQVQDAAVALFRRGMELARNGGLVLVDTKYEFGLLDGELILIDEVHTPDSSRYWLAKTEDNYDKEFLRTWLVEQGYRGEGDPPSLPDDVIQTAANRYIDVYTRLTGQDFVVADQPIAQRIIDNLAEYKRN